MISRETIESFFRDARRRGANLDREMLWGYFFTHRERRPLERMQSVVERIGYTYVGVLEPTAEDDNPVLFLHIERVERHDASSLFERCEELDAMARKHELASFDGFDVGNVDGSALHSD